MEILGLTHIGIIGLIACFVLLLQYVGCQAKRRGFLHPLNKWLGLGLIVIWLLYNIFYLHPTNFDWAVSLPLHVCDILGLIAGLALLTGLRLARAILFFSAMLFAMQAVITPTGLHNLSDFRFWLYWILHAAIIAYSLFDVVINDFRPRMKDLFQVMAVNLVYVLIVFPLNIAFDWNYGFIGNVQLDDVTMIDILGAWPQRVGLMLILAVSVQVAVFIIFWFLKKKNVKE